MFLLDLPKAFDPPQTDLSAREQPEQQPQRGGFAGQRALGLHPPPELQLQPLDGVRRAQRKPLARGEATALRGMLQAEMERSPDFVRLANALSALYPKDSEEKRLLDAMLLAVPR